MISSISSTVRLLRDRLFHGAHQAHRSPVTRPTRRDARAHARPGQREISDTIQRLVPHELVGPAQASRSDHAILVEHDRVVERRALNQPHRPQRLDLVHEPERPRRAPAPSRNCRA